MPCLAPLFSCAGCETGGAANSWRVNTPGHLIRYDKRGETQPQSVRRLSRFCQRIREKACNRLALVGAIAAASEPRRSRKYFGSLVLAIRDNATKRWVYAGHVGTGL
jgi:hypothetical protein